MKLYPTSGQTSSNMVHSARPPQISASSFASNGCSGAAFASDGLSKRKKDLLQRSTAVTGLRTQFIKCADPTHLPPSQEEEAVANALRVSQLVNGENNSAPRGGLRLDDFDHAASLAKIEAVEWFIHEQHVVWRQEAKRQQ